MAKLILQQSERRLAVARPDGQTLLTQNAAKDLRPFIHPIVRPDGRGVLTEDAPSHHIWQHGLYVGLNGVNGWNYWTEGTRADPKVTGSFHPRPLARGTTEGDTVGWSVVTDWRAPAPASGLWRSDVMVETQQWTLRDAGSTFLLDMTWTLQACGPVTFAQYLYGGLFLCNLARGDNGGKMLNSRGQVWLAGEQQRAEWVAVQIPSSTSEIASAHTTPAGIAIFDHPGNAGHPSHWRLGNHMGINPSRAIAGAWRLEAGESVASRYRVYVFSGAIDAPAIQAEFGEYARQT